MRTVRVNRPIKDFPYADIVPRMARFVSEGKAVLVKFTCSHCGVRAMGKNVNDWSPFQTCLACGHQHNFEKSGGNYAVSELWNPTSDLPDATAALKKYKSEGPQPDDLEIEEPKGG